MVDWTALDLGRECVGPVRVSSDMRKEQIYWEAGGGGLFSY